MLLKYGEKEIKQIGQEEVTINEKWGTQTMLLLGF